MIPRTPAEWAAIGEKRTHADYELSASWRESDGAPHGWLDLAAASRIDAEERCVERLAAWLVENSGDLGIVVSSLRPDGKTTAKDILGLEER